MRAIAVAFAGLLWGGLLFWQGEISSAVAPSAQDVSSMLSSLQKLRADYWTLVGALRDFDGRYFDPAATCEGRLTLASATPVPTTNQSGSTLYFTPFHGNHVALYNGTLWTQHVFTERSLALSGLNTSLNYDVFLYNNAGTLTLETTAWTDGTTRATALVEQNGVHVRTGATTRRYLGTFRPTAATTTEDSLTKRFVWNYCKPIVRIFSITDTTNSWTYNTAAWRQVRATATNMVEFVFGMSDVLVRAKALAVGQNSDASITRFASGIGTATGTNVAQLRGAAATNAIQQQAWSHYTGYLGLGYRPLYWLEYADGTDTITFFGDNNVNRMQSGMMGEISGG